MADDPERTYWAVRRPAVIVGAAVAAMIAVWILATPPSAGPDEPGHNVRAGALVRGQLDGRPLTASVFQEGFEIPAHIGFPDPVCYAFQPDVPARCATELPSPSGDTVRGTRSADYPVWGHLLAGVGTFASSGVAPWAARWFDALVPLALVTASIVVAARRRALGAGSALLALTPMAWFMFAVVNPSGLVIAGGVGLWVALLADAGRDRGVAWLAALSWAAMVLPRRDGLVWAVLVLSLALLISGEEGPARWRRLGRGPQASIAVSTLVTLAWASRSDTNAALALWVTPLVPVSALAGRWAWRRWVMRVPGRRVIVVVLALAVTALASIVVVGGLSDARRGFLQLVIGLTGADLTEAIGVLGWLDTPVPTSALFLWCVGLGLLAGAAVVADRVRLLVGATAILVVGIGMSWLLTMVQTDDTVNYWQGRYYLPLLAGVPLVFGRIRLAADAARRLGVVVAAVGVAVVNVALAAVMRRFGVGTFGSMLPWDWDTYDAPVPPVVLLAVHVAASVVLVWWVWSLGVDGDEPGHEGDEADGPAGAGETTESTAGRPVTTGE